MYGWTDPNDPDAEYRRPQPSAEDPAWLTDRPEPRSAYLFGDDPVQDGPAQPGPPAAETSAGRFEGGPDRWVDHPAGPAPVGDHRAGSPRGQHPTEPTGTWRDEQTDQWRDEPTGQWTGEAAGQWPAADRTDRWQDAQAGTGQGERTDHWHDAQAGAWQPEHAGSWQDEQAGTGQDEPAGRWPGEQGAQPHRWQDEQAGRWQGEQGAQPHRWQDEQAGRWQDEQEAQAGQWHGERAGPWQDEADDRWQDQQTGQWRGETPRAAAPDGPWGVAQDAVAYRGEVGSVPADRDATAFASAVAPVGGRMTPADRDRPRRRLKRPLLIGGAAAAATLVVSLGIGALVLPDDDERADRAAFDAPVATAPVIPDAAPSTDAQASPSPTPSPSTASPTPTPSPSPSRTGTPTPTPSRTQAASRQTTRGGAIPTAATTTRAAASGGGGSQAQQVVDLVNAERAKAGCAAVTVDDKLTLAAQQHSQDQADHKSMTHTGSDGSNAGQRLDRASYSWRTYGENVAWNQQTPAAVMNAWMNSSGHRANILNCAFTEIGVGVASSNGPYWTQDFAAPR
ncbi:CAP domain-containing protein [Micromonospora matsumotoense]|uniref:CAP domain-containing protein n=1 Tax=Micromonospora matsumotoense TaxID=121616 RepID=UPI0033D1FE56